MSVADQLKQGGQRVRQDRCGDPDQRPCRQRTKHHRHQSTGLALGQESVVVDVMADARIAAALVAADVDAARHHSHPAHSDTTITTASGASVTASTR